MFGVVDALSKLLVAHASPVQIVWARYFLAFPTLLFVVRPRDLPRLFSTTRPKLQLARGLTPLAVSFGMVLGVRYLPLADATVILFAAPLLMVALSGPMLGEKVRPSSWYAVALGFLAVLLVARPGFSVLSQYAIFPLVAAVFYALLQIITRRLSAAGERPVSTLAWTLATGSVATTPMVALFWNDLNLANWALMLALGIAFGVSQLTMISGLARAPISLTAPLIYAQVVSAVVLGVLVFNEVPDLWTLLGIVMIVGAGLYVVGQRRRS